MTLANNNCIDVGNDHDDDGDDNDDDNDDNDNEIDDTGDDGWKTDTKITLERNIGSNLLPQFSWKKSKKSTKSSFLHKSLVIKN